MKDKLRGFLGFLGLIEDEYGEYGSTGSAPARPFTDSSPRGRTGVERAHERAPVPDLGDERRAASPHRDAPEFVDLGARLLGSGLARSPDAQRVATRRVVVLARARRRDLRAAQL